MAKKREQFDECLGGSESLPHEVSIMQFVSSRAREISAMTSSIENPRQSKLIFQRLPVYMRRRVMSHNVKRLPRRLREAHSAQMAKSANGGNLPSTNKRPSRKYRRRPRNLLSEYSRRQRNKIWLETHIWHAKRFHMIDKWGYKIANYSNSKNFRAGYRAVTQNCLLQDVSYYTCIEIVGEENLLGTTLNQHCNPGKTFAAKMYTNGQREDTVMFFKKNGYPHFPIGNVDFFWRLSKTNTKTIWIWVHPAFYDDFLNEIISSFEFKQNDADQNNVERNKTNILHNLNNFYTNDAGCKMTVLRYALNRLRLCGPLALSVLRNALHVPSLTELDVDTESCTVTEEQDSLLNNEKLDKSKISTDNDVPMQPAEKMTIENEKDTKDLSIQDLNKKMWHTKYFKERENIEAFKIQEQLWQSMEFLRSPIYLPSNMIMGLTVLDPRFHLPEKRTKVEEAPSDSEELDYQLPIDLNRSPIWDAQIRHIVGHSCVPTSTINKLRSKCLVPGMSNDQYFSKDVMAKIPILLIQKPALAPSGLGSRIDIILPSRWAMPFWIALIMRCARVGALRESKLVAFESLRLDVPDINDPDTPAYTREALIRKEELIKKYFSYPPSRRVNYSKFGIRSPFFCDWKNLTKDWSDVEDFYVLRNLFLLSRLKAEMRPVKRKDARSKSAVQDTQFNFQDFEEYKNCLVQVGLSMVRKGKPEEFAIICMPTHEDLRRFQNDKKYAGPFEKCHTDPNEKSRKILRKEHLTQLKRLRRHRVERKKKLQDNVLPEEFDVIHDVVNRAKLAEHSKMISDQAKKMRKLYLPESTDVRRSCDREVMGYVTIGGYSLLRAKGIAVGYVTLPSLLEIIRKKSDVVFVRNTNRRQYRLAKLEILLNF